MAVASPTLDQLGSATEAVDTLIDGIRDDQWSAPTPCTEWTVRDLIGHLVGMNRVFTALLRDQPLPQRGDHPLGDDPLGAFRDTSTALRAAFEQPGTLERAIVGPLGSATDRRLTPALAHQRPDRARVGSGAGHRPTARPADGPGGTGVGLRR